MNNILKKKYAGALAALLALTLAATGCGSSSGSSNTTAAEDTTAAVTEATESAEDTTAGEETTGAETADTEEAAESGSGDTILVKAATSATVNPYTYVNDDNEVTGYDIEVLKEIFNRLDGYELEIEVTDFASIFSGVNSGNYQIAVNNFSYSEERAESYLFSYAYDKISYVFVTREGEEISSFADAAGLSFEGRAGVSVTTAVETWNEKNPDAQIDISYTEAETIVGLQHILDGSVDFGVIDLAMYNAYTKEYDLTGLTMTEIPEDEAKIISENVYAYFLFALDGEELRDTVDEVLVELKEDGTLTALSEEFFGIDAAPEDNQFVETLN
ncbi:MAG: transporter substrate-binding domain-containing protein [Lachnospiraceae bacterium]|nr:transporter substrate-binding domain-containing protein [Lachnospiraceae bacterium]